MSQRQAEEKRGRILAVMASQPGYRWTARTVAERVWTRLGGGTSRRSGQWQSMGRVLNILRRDGLVEMTVSDTAQKTWNLTAKGRKLAEEKP